MGWPEAFTYVGIGVCIAAVLIAMFKSGMNTITIDDSMNTGPDEIYTDFFKCPHCEEDEIIIYYKYCPMCGYKIKWEIRPEVNIFR